MFIVKEGGLNVFEQLLNATYTKNAAIVGLLNVSLAGTGTKLFGLMYVGDAIDPAHKALLNECLVSPEPMLRCLAFYYTRAMIKAGWRKWILKQFFILHLFRLSAEFSMSGSNVSSGNIITGPTLSKLVNIYLNRNSIDLDLNYKLMISDLLPNLRTDIFEEKQEEITAQAIRELSSPNTFLVFKSFAWLNCLGM